MPDPFGATRIGDDATFCGSEIRDRLDGTPANAYRRLPGRRPPEGQISQFVSCACCLPRASAKRTDTCMSRELAPSKRWNRPERSRLTAPGSTHRRLGGDRPPLTCDSIGRGSLLSITARRSAAAVSSACAGARRSQRCTVRAEGASASASASTRTRCRWRPSSATSHPQSAVATTRLQNHTEARSSGGLEWRVLPLLRWRHRCLCTVTRVHDPPTHVERERGNVPCLTHSSPGRSPRYTRRPSASRS